MNTPTAVVPHSHAIVLNRETIDEFVVKYKTHIFRMQSHPDHDIEHTNGTVYTIDHKFESMESWSWLGVHDSDISALNAIASYTNSRFGYVDDSQLQTFDSLTPPFHAPRAENGYTFLWFDPGEYVVTYVDTPALLPMEFWPTGAGGSYWFLGIADELDKQGVRVPIGSRDSIHDDIDIVDIVDTETNTASERLCELADIPCISPPSSAEIERVWDAVSSHTRDTMFR